MDPGYEWTPNYAGDENQRHQLGFGRHDHALEPGQHQIAITRMLAIEMSLTTLTPLAG